MALQLEVLAVVMVAIVLANISRGLRLARSGEADPPRTRYAVEIRNLPFEPAELMVVEGTR